MKNNSPSVVVTDAIDAFKNAKRAVVDADALHAQHAARLDDLLLNGDLSDEKVLSEIGKLNIFVSVYQRRSTLQQNAVAAAETNIGEVVETFKRQVMIPRVRNLNERMQKKVEADLRPHFSKEGLAAAVASSTIMREITHLSPSIGQYGAPDQNNAINLIAAWDRMEALENTLY